MTTPLWCLAAACVLPYVWILVSARERVRMGYDNRHPRQQIARLEGAAARAIGAHQNGFEALATFAPAVFTAHLAGADPAWLARLALLFVACRVLHGVCYVADWPLARSAVWGAGALSTLGLFALAAAAG